MALGIRIGNETLDLPPGTKLDLESENPFLQFEDQITGEFSYPFQVKASEKNLRLLNFAAILQQRVPLTGIDAVIIDDGLEIKAGKIKIEKADININVGQRGFISCYFLTGASGFYQDIKDKRMRDIDVGGDRTFDLSGATLQASAFGVHINTVLNHSVGVDDYAFYPVINESWGDDPGAPINAMNLLYSTGPTLGFLGGPIVPFPYLKYVLLKAVEHVGWTIEGSILDDADFKAITMINFRAIDWGYWKRGTGTVRHASCTFNLQDNLPDISIAQFLIALKNRFGWWYDFDNSKKKITINFLKNLVDLTPTDLTSISSPIIPKTISPQKEIYGLTQTGFDAGLKLSQLDYQGNVDSLADLPAAAEALSDQVYLVTEENNYYYCKQSEDNDSVWEWQILSPNIYNYEPEGMTKSVNTDAVTVAMEYYDDDYFKLVPRVDNTGIWSGSADSDWQPILCFYFGLRIESGEFVPSASHHIYDAAGVQKAQWNLAYKAEKNDGTQVGLYDLNWKPFLDMLNSSEEMEFNIYPGFPDLLTLKFSDRIVVDGVAMFIKKIKSSIPYRGVATVTAIRV